MDGPPGLGVGGDIGEPGHRLIYCNCQYSGGFWGSKRDSSSL